MARCRGGGYIGVGDAVGRVHGRRGERSAEEGAFQVQVKVTEFSSMTDLNLILTGLNVSSDLEN